jgi:Secretion system C-terminal sorting domain/Receptor L domain
MDIKKPSRKKMCGKSSLPKILANFEAAWIVPQRDFLTKLFHIFTTSLFHMKCSLTLLLFAFFAASAAYAQPGCPSSAFILSTQAQVDAFDDIHPDCHNLQVLMTVTGADITNLNGLTGIQKTTNSVVLRDNPLLSSLKGLGNLTSIGIELKIENNDALKDFSGLEKLSFVGGHFSIEGNDLLTSLNGIGPIKSLGSYLNISFNPVLTDVTALNSLTELGPDYFNAFLAINNNNSLVSLNGLDKISRMGSYFYLGHNPALTTLNGLNGLTTVKGSFEIENNGKLNDLKGFTSLTTVGGLFSIANNPALTNIDEFGSLKTVGGTFSIAYNSSLRLCASDGLCAFVASPDAQVTIKNNATGCNSDIEVKAACRALPAGEVLPEDEESKLAISPNPTTGPLWIKGEAKARKARVFDFTGRMILEKNLSESSLIDLFGQPSGVYFIEIQTDKWQALRKVIKA